MPDWRRRGPDKPDSETIKFLAEDVDSLRMVGDHRDVGNTGMEISERSYEASILLVRSFSDS